MSNKVAMDVIHVRFVPATEESPAKVEATGMGKTTSIYWNPARDMAENFAAGARAWRATFQYGLGYRMVGGWDNDAYRAVFVFDREQSA